MKEITGYEGLYAVTSCGKVWGYKRKQFLKPAKTKDGYLQVGLCKDGKQKTYYVHRLVCNAYHENPNNLPEVNHKDENKTNNCVNNLEFCSRKSNVNYGTSLERMAQKRRKPIYCIELAKTFSGIRKAAEALNIGSNAICSCLKGKYKTAGGYHWKYL